MNELDDTDYIDNYCLETNKDFYSLKRTLISKILPIP